MSRKNLRVQVTGLFAPLVNDFFLFRLLFIISGPTTFIFVFKYIQYGVLKRIADSLKSTFWYRQTLCYLKKKEKEMPSRLQPFTLAWCAPSLKFYFSSCCPCVWKSVVCVTLYFFFVIALQFGVFSVLCCATVFPLCFWTDLLLVACFFCWPSVPLTPIVTVQLNNIETH